MGKEQKKGEKGIAANYITRNLAIKKLKITLKDFRRLCILKGIYPRDPKKKKYGRNKTYYHIKDIKFLAHEPLLIKFRAIKSFVKKYKKAMTKRDFVRAKRLERAKPQITLDHLVRERYPSFADALRDLDDPLSLCVLFASLPSGLIKSHTAERAHLCNRLAIEFRKYVQHTQCLDKVFLSIKGVYYQAVVRGEPVTWLVPHKFNQYLPTDVDYRVMLTFLQFSQTLLKFVNFKLYHDEGLAYPPKLDDVKVAKREGLAAVQMQTIEEKQQETQDKADEAALEASSSANPKLIQESIRSIIEKLPSEQDSTASKTEEMEDDGEEKVVEDFSAATTEELFPQAAEQSRLRNLFNGLIFVLNREVPQEVMEFVIMSAGGIVLLQNLLTPEQMASEKITHQVVDRNIKNMIPGRTYVQPQWVVDSFNARALLPDAAYAPGAVPPPHLSPFVDNVKEGYVPEQARVLEKWGGMTRGGPLPAPQSEEVEAAPVDPEAAAEAQYQKEMTKERAGITFSEAAEQPDEEDDEEDDEEEEDEEEDEEVDDGKIRPNLAPRIVPASFPSAKATGSLGKEDDSKELAKMMMGKKAARIYSRMQYGIKRKEEANKALADKKRRLDEAASEEARPAKRAKLGGSKKGSKKKSSRK